MTISANNIAVAAPARLALYDDFMSCPRIVEIAPDKVLPYLDALSTQTYNCAKELGGSLPYTVIRELCENFIHAGFAEICISVYDGGNTICFSDQGPGISNKETVLEPGVTSATQSMKQFIRGVGSGLPVSREYMSAHNGVLEIRDNITTGCVVLISLHSRLASAERSNAPATSNADDAIPHHLPGDTVLAAPPLSPRSALTKNSASDFFHQYDVEPLHPRGGSHNALGAAASAGSLLSKREANALKLIETSGIIGPTSLAKQLRLSTATAFRLLRALETKGLVLCAPNKKRLLTQAGLSLLSEIG